jgi:hypothetical protein
MIFDLSVNKCQAMNKIILISTCLVTMISCATSKTGETSQKETIHEKSLVQQAELKQAVEARRFLIKFNKLYYSHGGMIDLKPTYNYILLDGERVVISAAYMGRQYGNRPIKGIDMVGKAVSFELKNNTSKGIYEIKMKVKNDLNTFDLNVTITNDGYCNASVASYKIDYVRYTGSFIPLKPKEEQTEPAKMSI